ncbi:MAG: SDR family NAD(P)-dependent oxidoreductase [Candidatus Latescibacteria bacterium]|nr:SDR family NAD(P)-dependent oxidoreductase [Candidatus Latescibacterota bacterium]
MGKLDGKVALVTGAGRGLGRAYALHLAKLGAHVVVNDISLKAHEEYDEVIGAASVPEEIEAMGVRSLGIECDVTDRAQVEKMIAEVDETFGRLDILVNNAGGALFGRLEFEAMFALNFHGTVHCCEATAEIMKRQGSGKIVNVGSQAGLQGGMGQSYATAKAAVIHYTRCLALTLGSHNVNVNCIAPGWILSSRAIAQGRADKETRESLEKKIALGRLGMPEDCAKVIEFLVTDLSDYVTGQTIAICGGAVLF